MELLRAHGAIIDELRVRDIVRSANSPISDFAEVLFCRAYGWTREGNSMAGYDATDAFGVRYQIKARRLRHGLSTGTERRGTMRLLLAWFLSSDRVRGHR